GDRLALADPGRDLPVLRAAVDALVQAPLEILGPDVQPVCDRDVHPDQPSDGRPRVAFIAIMLCPLATAAFVSWGPRWQFAMGVTALLGYAAGEYLVPIETPFRMYRWMGLIA